MAESLPGSFQAGTITATTNLVIETGFIDATASWALYSGTVKSQKFENEPIWTFQHNLNKQPIVIQAYDLDYNQIIPSNVFLKDENQTIVSFPLTSSGYIIATFGGLSTAPVTGSTSSAIPVYSGKFDVLTSQTLNTENLLTITNDIITDPNNVITNASGVITFAQTGYYELSAQITIDYGSSVTDDGYITVKKNGTTYLYDNLYNTSVRYPQISINCLLNITSGDYIEIYLYARTSNYDTKNVSLTGAPCSYVYITKVR